MVTNIATIYWTVRQMPPSIQGISHSWVQTFVDRFCFVRRVHTRKHRVSPANEKEIEISGAARLGKLSNLFERRLVNGIDVENADETHFMIILENRPALGFCGTTEVKYVVVVNCISIYSLEKRRPSLTSSRSSTLSDDVPSVSYSTSLEGL